MPNGPVFRKARFCPCATVLHVIYGNVDLLGTRPFPHVQAGCNEAPLKGVLEVIPVGLYLLVGIISLLMAYKTMFSNKLLPFQEKAAGMRWNKIDPSIQCVLIALMRVSGLGFLVMGALLIISPIVDYFAPHAFVRYAVPLISAFYCMGLFLVNYSLYKRTKAPTPWKGSLCAVLIILAGIVISTIEACR